MQNYFFARIAKKRSNKVAALHELSKSFEVENQNLDSQHVRAPIDLEILPILEMSRVSQQDLE